MIILYDCLIIIPDVGHRNDTFMAIQGSNLINFNDLHRLHAEISQVEVSTKIQQYPERTILRLS